MKLLLVRQSGPMPEAGICFGGGNFALEPILGLAGLVKFTAVAEELLWVRFAIR